MHPSPGSNNNPTPHNQHNVASNGGNIIANNGGNQKVRINHGQRPRVWTWWALLVLVLVDVGFFFYGQAAYTGMAGNSDDVSRAVIFLVLFVMTVAMLRVCVRSLFR
ncbi:hypothetical protein ACQP0C_17680 [Nocardia sp. CA-129566]|uniref:hypothetical protein n=1 Tax=Nocardia sp. CA-129566 TaxID=3239976 RepID=UPI003D958E4C